MYQSMDKWCCCIIVQIHADPSNIILLCIRCLAFDHINMSLHRHMFIEICPRFQTQFDDFNKLHYYIPEIWKFRGNFGVIMFWFRRRRLGVDLGTIIKKSYDGGSVLSTSLGSKTLNNTSSLGLGGNQNLRPSCRRPPARTFHTPVGTLRLDAPALVWVRSPNDGNKLGWS